MIALSVIRHIFVFVCTNQCSLSIYIPFWKFLYTCFSVLICKVVLVAKIGQIELLSDMEHIKVS